MPDKAGEEEINNFLNLMDSEDKNSGFAQRQNSQIRSATNIETLFKGQSQHNNRNSVMKNQMASPSTRQARASNRVSFNANPLLASQRSIISNVSATIDEVDDDGASQPSMELPKGNILFHTTDDAQQDLKENKILFNSTDNAKQDHKKENLNLLKTTDNVKQGPMDEPCEMLDAINNL